MSGSRRSKDKITDKGVQSEIIMPIVNIYSKLSSSSFSFCRTSKCAPGTANTLYLKLTKKKEGEIPYKNSQVINFIIVRDSEGSRDR